MQQQSIGNASYISSTLLSINSWSTPNHYLYSMNFYFLDFPVSWALCNSSIRESSEPHWLKRQPWSPRKRSTIHSGKRSPAPGKSAPAAIGMPMRLYSWLLSLICSLRVCLEIWLKLYFFYFFFIFLYRFDVLILKIIFKK
jgi:hypothetical protein